MKTIKSSVLTLEVPSKWSQDLGSDWCENLQAGQQKLGQQFYPVLIIGASQKSYAEVLQFLKSIASQKKPSVILLNEDLSSEQIQNILFEYQLFAICRHNDNEEIELLLQKALSHQQQLQQNAELLMLFEQQNEQLRKLSQDLESRVEKRELSLRKSHEKLTAQNARLEGLLRALMAMQRSQSISEMELLLKNALQSTLGLTLVRIHYRTALAGMTPTTTPLLAIYSCDLYFVGRSLGHITYARERETFNRDEKLFLDQVTEAVTLALDRLTKLELVENLKAQWEATFDAISHPLSLIDEDYSILRRNQSYADLASAPKKPHCYEKLFGRSSPCENCKLGQSFELEAGDKKYSVFSQSVQAAGGGRSSYLVLYRDVTDERRLEQQIFESAKLAEMGTIGSSIAHELNNPLGGMISFLQLIKMDLQGDEAFYDDIVEMEKGAQRCKEIVQNLLGFSRKQGNEEAAPFDLRDAIGQALKITELQTRSKGIQVEAFWGAEPAIIRGYAKFFAQALCHLLQNSAEAISQRFGKAQLSAGKIKVRLASRENNFILEISDNGSRSSGLPALGISFAQQLVKEHAGRIDVKTSDNDATTVVTITIPRLVFDTQI